MPQDGLAGVFRDLVPATARQHPIVLRPAGLALATTLPDARVLTGIPTRGAGLRERPHRCCHAVRIELAATRSRGRTVVDRRLWSGDMSPDPHGPAMTVVEVALGVDAERYQRIWLDTAGVGAG